MSIDIGSHYLKCAVGNYKNNIITIDHLVKKEVPDGLINNGVIVDSDALVELIMEMQKTHKIKANNISFTISSSKVFQRELELSIVDNDSDRKNLISYEVEQFLPDEIENSIIQHRVLDEIDYGETKKHRVFVAVLSKDIVDRYYEVTQKLKLKPGILDLSSNAINRLLNLDALNKVGHPFESDSVLVLDIGFKTINACVYDRGVFKFCREIISGLNHMIDVMKDSAYPELSKVSYDDIQNEIYPHLNDEINYWIQEIRKIIRLYTNETGNQNLGQIMLAGGGSEIDFIKHVLQKELETKVELISPIDILEIHESVNTEELQLYINAIGNLVKE